MDAPSCVSHLYFLRAGLGAVKASRHLLTMSVYLFTADGRLISRLRPVLFSFGICSSHVERAYTPSHTLFAQSFPLSAFFSTYAKGIRNCISLDIAF